MSSRLLSPTWLGAAVIRYTFTFLEAAFAFRDREGVLLPAGLKSCSHIKSHKSSVPLEFNSESDGRCK